MLLEIALNCIGSGSYDKRRSYQGGKTKGMHEKSLLCGIIICHQITVGSKLKTTIVAHSVNILKIIGHLEMNLSYVVHNK